MKKKILFIGPPNSGKTSVFNLLSGSNRKVANYHGITVDTATADLKSNINNEVQIQVVDLPGIYSLVPSSIDESVTISTLIGKNNQLNEYHEIVIIIDAARMDSSLAVALGMKELFNDKIKIIFNKSDLSQAKNYDLNGIGKNIGVPFLITSAFKANEKEIDIFLRHEVSQEVIRPSKRITISQESTQYNPFNVVWNECKNIEISNEVTSLSFIEKYQRRARDLKSSYAIGDKKNNIKFTNKLDNITLHPFLGGIIFASIFYFIFHALYTLSAPLMDMIDTQVVNLGQYVGTLLPPGLFSSFIVDGLIAGVGGVIIFLPQIMILFFLLSLLEQSGYISRASIITDKLMAIFGLNGKAFLPFMSGFACSVPAIMATRTIANKRERLATLMVIPFITCSARLPVYVLIVGTFIPNETILGFMNTQALAFFFLYFLGSITALVMAKLFRLSFFKGTTSSFIIELPLYQRPSLAMATKSMMLKGKVFLRKAGTVILVLSMLIWLASTFPKPDSSLLIGKTDSQVASISLENSALGRLGKTIEPIIKPIGYNWKIGIGILVAMGARELFVSTLGTIYALGDVDEDSTSLRERMKAEISPDTGKPVYNTAVAWSLLIFFAFGMQCISTLAIVKRETESWKYPIYMFGYMTVMAYGGAFIVFRALS